MSFLLRRRGGRTRDAIRTNAVNNARDEVQVAASANVLTSDQHITPMGIEREGFVTS